MSLFSDTWKLKLIYCITSRTSNKWILLNSRISEFAAMSNRSAFNLLAMTYLIQWTNLLWLPAFRLVPIQYRYVLVRHRKLDIKQEHKPNPGLMLKWVKKLKCYRFKYRPRVSIIKEDGVFLQCLNKSRIISDCIT